MIHTATDAALYLVKEGKTLEALNGKIPRERLLVGLKGLIAKDRTLGELFKEVKDHLKGIKPIKITHASNCDGPSQIHYRIYHYLAHTPFPNLTARRYGCDENETIALNLQRDEKENKRMREFLFQLGSQVEKRWQFSLKEWTQREILMHRSGALVRLGKRISWFEAFQEWGKEVGGDAQRIADSLKQMSIVEPMLSHASPPQIEKVVLSNEGLKVATSFATWLVQATLRSLSDRLEVDLLSLPCSRDLMDHFLNDEEGRKAILYFIYKKALNFKILEGETPKTHHLARLMACFIGLKENVEAPIAFETLYQAESLDLFHSDLPFLTELTLFGQAGSEASLQTRVRMCLLLSRRERPHLILPCFTFLQLTSYETMLDIVPSLAMQIEGWWVEYFGLLTDSIQPQNKALWMKRLLGPFAIKFDPLFLKYLYKLDPSTFSEGFILWLLEFIETHDLDLYKMGEEILQGLEYLQKTKCKFQLDTLTRLKFLFLIQKKEKVKNALSFIKTEVSDLTRKPFICSEELWLKAALKHTESIGFFALSTIGSIHVELQKEKREITVEEWVKIYLAIPRPQVPMINVREIQGILKELGILNADSLR